jgi:hypothetical protein
MAVGIGKHEAERKHHKLFLSEKLWKRDNLEYIDVYGRINFRNELGGRGLDYLS